MFNRSIYSMWDGGNMIKIVCVGKIKESFYRDAIEEYKKRLSKYTDIEIIEVPDEGLTDIKTSIKKESEKTFEKSLTKKRNCDIIEKLSEKNSEQHLENWTMYEYNTTLEIPFWEKEGKLRKVRED